MPTYEYQCTKCGEQFEMSQSMMDPPLTVCPKVKCRRKQWGKGKVKKLISAGAGLLFKGSGFYITDYRSDNYKQSASKESSSDKPAGSDSKPGADTKSSGGDSKPAGGDSKSSGGDTKSTADTKSSGGDTKSTADTKSSGSTARSTSNTSAPSTPAKKT